MSSHLLCIPTEHFPELHAGHLPYILTSLWLLITFNVCCYVHGVLGLKPLQVKHCNEERMFVVYRGVGRLQWVMDGFCEVFSLFGSTRMW